MKARGMDELQQTMREATEAFENLDEQFEHVSFDPKNGRSVRAAIQKMEQLIDASSSEYPANPMVQNTGVELKQQYRKLIEGKASDAARFR